MAVKLKLNKDQVKIGVEDAAATTSAHLQTPEPSLKASHPHILDICSSFLKMSLQYLEISVPRTMAAARMWELAYVFADAVAVGCCRAEMIDSHPTDEEAEDRE